MKTTKLIKKKSKKTMMQGNTFQSILYSLLFISTLFCSSIQAQETARIVGKVTDKVTGEALVGVTIGILVDDEAISGASTDVDGRFDIAIPANQRVDLVFQYVGYTRLKEEGVLLEAGGVYEFNKELSVVEGPEVIVLSFNDKEADAYRVGRDDIQNIPTTTMNIEQVIQFLAPGVAAGTGGELTSQYSVRGGNYDENLVYVNGFEIYRPLLIRSGQQEGLTFPNPDMLDQLAFSSGGFKAQYGDKMASVLDVRYRRVRSQTPEVRLGGSLLGGTAYIGGAAGAKNQFTYGVGARYKTTRYILNTLDVEGEYIPNFVDIQADLIYDVSKRIQVELIGNYNRADFTLVPLEAATTTGLFNQALRLSSLFEGKEISDFTTWNVGTSVAYIGKTNNKDLNDSVSVTTSNLNRILVSNYQSRENERIDIQNFYRLEEIETGLGEEDFGEVIGTLAYGETHLFARNFLTANVTQARYVGGYSYERYKARDSLGKVENNQFIRWGVVYKNERIDDQLKEWTSFDSLGYTLPYDTTSIPIFSYVETDTNLNSHRLSAFLQNTWEYRSNKHFLRLTAGVRAQYWSLNKELILSPRMQIYYTPQRFHNSDLDTLRKTKDLTFKLAVGAYHQPPFYRELRNLDGFINTNVLAQKSLHAVAGVVWDFMMFKRRFKFITETYYKHQWDLVPYDVENVRIRYYGDNMATGYVAGIDMRLNGELVEGLESWVNLSFLRARDRFDGVQHKIYRLVGNEIDTILTNDVPKPTDQFMIFSMYFQDYLPKAEWCKVNLAFTVGTGMPFGVPRENTVARNLYRYSPYHRIDIGFSFGLWNRRNFAMKHYSSEDAPLDPDVAVSTFKGDKDKKHIFKPLRSAWLSLEVFNLMAVANVASNTWIKDFTNTSYAIPNFLTSRRLNVRLRIDF